MTDPTRNPEELRRMFGTNLRRLASSYPTVTALTRELGINRTQFNRYLSGESLPRPDVLDRICRFFDVDARILLKPYDEIAPAGQALAGDVLNEFLVAGATTLSETAFPSGFYRLAQQAGPESGKSCVALILVFRRGEFVFVRGYESRRCGPTSGARAREFRGYASGGADGISLFMSRRGAEDRRFVLVAPGSDGPARYWAGHILRVAPAQDGTPAPAARLVLDHLADGLPAALNVARRAGLVETRTLPPQFRRYLNGESSNSDPAHTP